MSEISEPVRRRLGGSLWCGLVLIALLVLVGVLAPPLLGERAETLFDSSTGPSGSHWLGTDAAGHDVLARSLVATRLSLLMATAATAISVVSGIVLGAGAWLLPRRGREPALRLIDTLVAFPPLLLALVVAAIIGPGAKSVVFALGIAATPSLARFTANLAGQVSRRDHVVTAKLMGVPRRRLLKAHLVPNMAEPLLVLTAGHFAQSLISISALSFVGLGVQSPHYDFGKLLNEALPAVFSGQPVQLLGPAVMIALTGLGAMLIGDGLAASTDPRLRGVSRPLATPRAGKRIAAPALPESAGPNGAPIASVRDLVVRRGDGTALVKGVSFDVHAGEILGVVGESGSGKSLTAMSLAHVQADGLRIEADVLRVGSSDLLDRPRPRTLAREVAMVYQDPGSTFNPALRLGTQLAEVLRVHHGKSRRAAREQVVEGLRSMRISAPEQRVRQHPHELSGGMRQRAMIAGALATGAQLLIADEPTTALDVTVQAEILRELRRVNQEQGVALVFISHDIEVVRALCHRVLVMRSGEIVEQVAATDLVEGKVTHPYTRALLAATPTLERKTP